MTMKIVGSIATTIDHDRGVELCLKMWEPRRRDLWAHRCFSGTRLYAAITKCEDRVQQHGFRYNRILRQWFHDLNANQLKG
jgi:hypothetical protein